MVLLQTYYAFCYSHHETFKSHLYSHLFYICHSEQRMAVDMISTVPKYALYVMWMHCLFSYLTITTSTCPGKNYWWVMRNLYLFQQVHTAVFLGKFRTKYGKAILVGSYASVNQQPKHLSNSWQVFLSEELNFLHLKSYSMPQDDALWFRCER